MSGIILNWSSIASYTTLRIHLLCIFFSFKILTLSVKVLPNWQTEHWYQASIRAGAFFSSVGSQAWMGRPGGPQPGDRGGGG